MYTQGDGLWIKNAAEEDQMVQAMRRSADATVKGVSAKGTETTDTFSMKGLSQALDRIAQDCSARTASTRLARAHFAPTRWISRLFSPRRKAYVMAMTDIQTSATAALSGGSMLVEKTPLESYVPPAKPSLIGLSRVELAERLGEIGVAPAQRKMRVQQLWHWLYFRGAKSFDEMTSVSKDIRAELAQHFTVDRPEVVAEQISNDGTRKWLLRLPSGDQVERPHEVECVYIPETDRGTLCVSSQVGCTLNCTFCHTGTQRLVRNLTAGEIVGQVMVARDRLNDWADRENGTRLVTNVVMMGMGEPLYNFDAVRDALLIVADNEGIGISRRRITLVDLGRGAEHHPHRRGDRRDARDLAACGARRIAQRAGAAQPQISDCRIAAGLPRLSGALPTRGASPSNM